jgi:hypothetical protein
MVAQEAFEQGALAYLLRNPALLKLYDGRLREEFFTLAKHRTLFTTVNSAYRQLGQPPTLAEVEQILSQKHLQHEWSLTQLEQTVRAARSAWKAEASPLTGEFLRREFIAREKEMLEAEFRALSPEAFADKVGDFRARLSVISQDHNKTDDWGISVFSEHGGFLTATAQVDDLYNVSPISTGYRLLDELLMGGLRPQEVTAIMAWIGVGKSLLMLNLAINMVRQGKRVMYFALDNTKAEMCDRVIACATGVPIQAGRLLEAYREELLQAMQHQYNDLFILVEWAPKRHKVADIKSHMEKAQVMFLREADKRIGREDRDGKTDVVFIDSGDHILPDTVDKRDQNWETKGGVYDDFLAFAKEEFLPVVVSTATNRGAAKLINLSMDNVSEAIGKFRPMGNVLALGQTQAEKVKREFRLQLLKTRRPEGAGFFFRMLFDPYRQAIVMNPEQTKPIPMWKSDGSEIDPHRYDFEGGPTQTGVAPSLPGTVGTVPAILPRAKPRTLTPLQPGNLPSVPVPG